MNALDLIIDALSVAQNSVWSKLNEQALAAARELKALKPVAWMKGKELTFKPPFKGHTEGWIKLYALDEDTK